MEKYPLHWPTGYSRTTRRIHSSFKQTLDRSQSFLHEEIRRLGATNLIVSTNIPIRNDGRMYALYMDRKLDDPGVAIYFELRGKKISMCCDRYTTVWENTYALGKGIEALRGMDRWGVSDFIERAFTGFTALPESTKTPWWEVMCFDIKPTDLAKVRQSYVNLAIIRHPDKESGSTEKMAELNAAYEEAKQELNA